MSSSSAAGSATNLSESRAEALQALLNSLAPGAEAGREGAMNTSKVRRISDRLSELLGEDTSPDSTQRNEKGELVNEEGLPIIDIVEPVPSNAGLVAIPVPQELDVIPLWALSPQEKARRRAERERILDLLEEEERIQTEKDEEAERERFKVDLEKRKQVAEAEMETLKKAREMQKKMGKALLKNLAVAREREDKERRAEEEAEKHAREQRQKLKPKKSVTFADLPPDHEYQPANSVPMPPPFDWGDVTPARLPMSSKSPLVTKDQTNQGTMRMQVVERMPGLKPGPKSPPPPRQADSDDESEPNSSVIGHSDEEEVDASNHSDTEEPTLQLDESDDSDYGVLQDNEPVEWDVDGYDFAQHQREIALAYYEKRAAVGADALAAMRNHEHPDGEHAWDQPDVPLEATLASAPPKPSISRFRASHTHSFSSLPSHSLGSSVLPASRSSELKAAVRLGNLENGALVGGDEGESDEELEPEAMQVLQMLKKGDVVNVGPHLSSINPPDDALPGASVPTALSTRLSVDTNITTPVKTSTSRLSQLKLSLVASSSSPRTSSSLGSSLATPIANAERSSPKPTQGKGTPIPMPTRTPQRVGPSVKAHQKHSMQMPGTIVDSPSFPAPGVIASPSFPGPSRPPSSVSSPSSQTNTTPVSVSVLERRSMIATQVSDSLPGPLSAGAAPIKEKEKKVSRFRAERG